jgi:hypothetical protein
MGRIKKYKKKYNNISEKERCEMLPSKRIKKYKKKYNNKSEKDRCEMLPSKRLKQRATNRKGFIKPFKSNSISSKKTQKYKNHLESNLEEVLFHDRKLSWNEKQVVETKEKRLDDVPIIEKSEAILEPYLAEHLIFFDTDAKDETFDRLYESNKNDKTLRVNVLDYLQVVDDVKGCRMFEDFASIIVTLVPRDFLLYHTGKNAMKDYKAIESIILQNKKTVRGNKRKGLSLEYATIGAHVKRGGYGISVKFGAGKNLDVYKHFETMVNRIETIATSYLPPMIMKFAKKAKEAVGCDKSLNVKTKSVWSSAAMTWNYVSAAHTDNDCFVCAITVLVDAKSHEYGKNDDIAVYFCLPECGKAIGLRPGDVLCFNPLYYHCVSKRTKAYEKRKVFLCSFYMKTGVISGNDNREVIAIETEEVV